MRLAKSLLPIFLFSAFPLFATAWPKEPADFEGLKFGKSTEADLKARVKVTKCWNTEDVWNMPLRTCSSTILVGELSVRTFFIFHEGRLRMVTLLDLPSERFEYIRNVFVARYGQPAKAEKKPFKTKGGKEYLNEELKWWGKALQIRVKRFGGDVNTMSAYIGLKEFVERIEGTSKTKKTPSR